MSVDRTGISRNLPKTPELIISPTSLNNVSRQTLIDLITDLCVIEMYIYKMLSLVTSRENIHVKH